MRQQSEDTEMRETVIYCVVIEKARQFEALPGCTPENDNRIGLWCTDIYMEVRDQDGLNPRGLGVEGHTHSGLLATGEISHSAALNLWPGM